MSRAQTVIVRGLLLIGGHALMNAVTPGCCRWHRVLLLGALLTTFAGPAYSQTPASFGTCAYWLDQKPDPTKPATVDIRRTYRLGFAAGFVFGTLGDLPEQAEADPQWAALQQRFLDGQMVALQRPAFLVDAFDRKCDDYRNRRVRLHDVGLLIFLEVAGAPTQGIERALEIMRGGDVGSTSRALEALMDSR